MAARYCWPGDKSADRPGPFERFLFRLRDFFSRLRVTTRNIVLTVVVIIILLTSDYKHTRKKHRRYLQTYRIRCNKRRRLWWWDPRGRRQLKLLLLIPPVSIIYEDFQ